MRDAASTPRIDVSFQTIDDLLDETQAGRLRVPAFQRPFRWKPADMIDLFDSIRKGYPIGGILLWHPLDDVESDDRVGPIQIPPRGRDLRLIVDGHQRIATLFGTLRLSAKEAANRDALWPWVIYYDLIERNFLQIRRGKPEAWQLPLRLLRRTTELLAFADQLQRASLPAGITADELLDETDALSQRFKGYKLLLMTLENGDVEDAVESFSRMNGKGREISGHETLSALTYRKGQFHLDRRIDDICRRLADIGFSNVSPGSVLRAILAVGGARDVYRTDWALVHKDMRGAMPENAARAETALVNAAELLRRLGVVTGRLLPYVHHLVFLAVYFDRHPRISPGDEELLKRWFWGTSFAGSFGGISAAETSRWLKAMRGDGFEEALSGPFQAEPYPKDLRLSSARSRVHVLSLFRELAPRGPDGEAIRASEIKAFEARAGLPYIFPDAPDDLRGDPANRALWPSSKDVRGEMILLNEADLRTHAIEGAALDALRNGRTVAFINERRRLLQDMERSFMATLQIAPPDRSPTDPIDDIEGAEDDGG